MTSGNPADRLWRARARRLLWVRPVSEEPEKPAASEPAGAKPSKLILLLLVLNLGGTGFAVFKLLTTSPAMAASAHDPAPPPAPTSEVTGPTLALDPFVVNLDEPGNARYLRVKLNLELVSGESEASVNKSMLLVRDVILSHLSGLKLADTLGGAAKEKVRADLGTKLEAQIGPHKVRRIFFTEWVVQ